MSETKLDFATTIPSGPFGTSWRWSCISCKLRGLKGEGEQVTHWSTAARAAMKHNVSRHVGLLEGKAS